MILFIVWGLIGLRWYIKHGNLANIALYMLYGSLVFIALNAYNMFITSTAELTNITILAISVVIALAAFRIMRSIA
ncbi:MAG: hypothetical protein QXT65_04580 [Candidatus Nitrosocaldaceae archaeon]